MHLKSCSIQDTAKKPTFIPLASCTHSFHVCFPDGAVSTFNVALSACLALQIFVTAFSLYEIATQVFPYRELRAMEVVYCVIVKSTRPQIPLDCNISSDYYNLMTSCWSQTPDDRPSFSEIVCKVLFYPQLPESGDMREASKDKKDKERTPHSATHPLMPCVHRTARPRTWRERIQSSCVCVCVCVCARARERKKERKVML